MAPQSDDGFEYEEEPPAVRPRQPRRAAGVEEDYEDEYDDEENGRDARRDTKAGLDAVVAGITPQTLKLALAGVLVLAVLLVIGASVYRKKKEEGEKRARKQAYLQQAIGYMAGLHKMGVDYFTDDGEVPEGFRTRFKPVNEDDERRSIIGVWIQSKKPTSRSFDTRLVEVNHQFADRGERRGSDTKPLSGTYVYMSRGKVAIKGPQYDVRIFRQDILDENGKVLGRVALMMFPEKQ